MYVKMMNSSLVKYYKRNKERLQKQARTKYQNLSKEEKVTVWLQDIKAFLNMKNKCWLSIEKKLEMK